MQRIGRHAARVILIAPSGSGVPDALVLVEQPPGPAVPAHSRLLHGNRAAPAAAARHGQGAAPGRGATVTRCIDLPAATAPAAPGMLRATARAYRALQSVQSEQVLASSPTRSVTTTFVSQAPNRVAVNVHGGHQQVLIGNVEYVQQPDGSWKKQSLGPGGGIARSRSVLGTGGDRRPSRPGERPASGC